GGRRPFPMESPPISDLRRFRLVHERVREHTPQERSSERVAMGHVPVAPSSRGSAAATTVAGTLIGAGLGLLVGWAVAEARILGGHVDPNGRTTYFVSAVLICGAVGGLLGTAVGAGVARSHPAVGTRTLLRTTALVVATAGLLFAWLLND